MALQSSGAISISQIKSELGSASNSLRTLSSQAGKSAPDSFSEFYGYSSYSPPYGPYQTYIDSNTSNAYHRLRMHDGFTLVDYYNGSTSTFNTAAGRGLHVTLYVVDDDSSLSGVSDVVQGYIGVTANASVTSRAWTATADLPYNKAATPGGYSRLDGAAYSGWRARTGYGYGFNQIGSVTNGNRGDRIQFSYVFTNAGGGIPSNWNGQYLVIRYVDDPNDDAESYTFSVLLSL